MNQQTKAWIFEIGELEIRVDRRRR